MNEPGLERIEATLPAEASVSSEQRGPGGSAPWGRRDTLAVAASALLAFSLRMMLVALTLVVGTDSPKYLIFAEEMIEGTWAPSLDNGIHPGYPAAIVLAFFVLGSIEFAGFFVSAFFSSLAVVPLYALAWSVAGRRAATLSSLFYACFRLFVREHGDVMTEGLYHFFIITALSLAWFGAKERRFTLILTLLSGLAAGLAYLTRPEGILVPLAVAGIFAVVLVARWIRTRRIEVGLVLSPLAAGVVSLVVALPLLLWFRQATGTWTVSKRASVEATLGGAPGSEGGSAIIRAVEWAGEPSRAALFVAVALGVAAGVTVLRRRVSPSGMAALIVVTAISAVPPLAAAAAGYPSSYRHIMASLILALPLFAALILVLVDGMARRIGRRGRWVQVAASILFGIALTGSAVSAVHPRRINRIPVKGAALWLAPRIPPGGWVYANTGRLQYYIGSRTGVLPWTLDELKAFTLRESEFFFIVEDDFLEAVPGGMEFLEANYHRISRFPAEPWPDADRVSIFRR